MITLTAGTAIYDEILHACLFQSMTHRHRTEFVGLDMEMMMPIIIAVGLTQDSHVL